MRTAFWTLVTAAVASAVAPWGDGARGESIVIFGPVDVLRGTEKPVEERFSFPQGNPGHFHRLEIVNGGDDGSFARARSAVVRLNGDRIVGPSAWGRKTAFVDRALELRPDNELAIELRGPPGSGVSLRVVAEPPVTVPNVGGLEISEAESVLEEAGLRAGDLVDVLSLVVPAGSVAAQDPPPFTEVLRGTKVDLERAAPVRGGALFSEDWAGPWRFSTEFVDLTTGILVSKEVTNVTLCPEDPLGLVVLEQAARRLREDNDDDDDDGKDNDVVVKSFSGCSVDLGNRVLEVSCSGEIELQGACTVAAAVSVTGERVGDDFIASGEWTSSALGLCGLLLSDDGERFAISARRVASDRESCQGTRPSLTQQLLRRSQLLDLQLGPVRGDDYDELDDEDDGGGS